MYVLQEFCNLAFPHFSTNKIEFMLFMIDNQPESSSNSSASGDHGGGGDGSDRDGGSRGGSGRRRAAAAAPTVAEAATDAAAACGVLCVLENIVFPVPRRHINAYLPT